MTVINQMIKYIKNNIFSFLLGIIIIIITFWNRVFRIRVPKTLDDFNSIYMIFIIFVNVFILLLLIVTSIYYLTNSKKKNSFIITYILQYEIVNYILQKLNKTKEYMLQGPKTVYKLFFNHINISHILEVPFYKISHYIKELPVKFAYLLTIIHLFFNTLPKLIPSVIFMLEVCLVGQLNYFYKSLFLYLIILLYKILLWILADLSDSNIYFATAHIEITYHNKDDYSAVLNKEIPVIEGAIDIVSRKYDQKLLEWFVYIYDTYVDIKWFVYRLDLEQQKFKYYEILITSIFYLFGWLYILFPNFF